MHPRFAVAAAVLCAGALACADNNPIAPRPSSLVALDASTAYGKSSGKKVRIKYVVGNNVVDNYDFDASEFDDGSVKGTFTLREKRFDPADKQGTKVKIKVKGEVVCIGFGLDGKKARLGGLVTKSTFEAGIPVGSYLVWSVTDNDDAKRVDTASPLLGIADPQGYCKLGLAFPENDLRKGDVVVDPTPTPAP